MELAMTLPKLAVLPLEPRHFRVVMTHRELRKPCAVSVRTHVPFMPTRMLVTATMFTGQPPRPLRLRQTVPTFQSQPQ